MNNFLPYSDADIDLMLYEPWEVTDRPYMLHAAYALSSLSELCASNSEDDEESDSETMWGTKIPKTILDRLVKDIAEDFNDAAAQYKPIKIGSKSFSIRKVNSYDKNRLTQIFNFPQSGDDCVVTRGGVLDLSGATIDSLKKYELSKEQSVENRIYLRQIIMLAEDDANNGWEKLTDMEVVLYCWALFYAKKQSECLPVFLNDYKDYIDVAPEDILSCYIAKAALREKPVGLYTFSKEKVMQWNDTHSQRSVAATIEPEIAEDYWYDVALKKNFRQF